jgi:hypothetical protein
MATKRTPQPDAGLQEIEDWYQWFLSGHLARLADTDMTPQQRESERAAVATLAANIAEGLREEYRARQAQP